MGWMVQGWCGKGGNSCSAMVNVLLDCFQMTNYQYEIVALLDKIQRQTNQVHRVTLEACCLNSGNDTQPDTIIML